MFSRVLKISKREFMCEYMLKATSKKKLWEKKIYIRWRQRQQIFIRKAPFKCSDIHEAISSLSNRVYLISTAATTTKNKNDNEQTAKRTNEWICVHLNKWHLWIKIYCVWSKHNTHNALSQQLMTSPLRTDQRSISFHSVECIYTVHVSNGSALYIYIICKRLGE